MVNKLRSGMPRWRKAMYGLGIAALFFLLLEGVLMMLGIQPMHREQDPFVGFSGHVPLFLETTAPGGERFLQTAKVKANYFNEQRFTRKKADGGYRIFCLGGSTTYGRPYDDLTSFAGWLRALLPKVDPATSWEVINCGGISYASYRVARLMEELVRYQPDAFVIYTGQNEFLERRTYARILETPALVRDLSALASRTRIYTVLSRWIRPSEKGATRAGDLLPSEVETVLDKSLGPSAYSRDDALASKVVTHFQHSLGRMIHLARNAGARVILVNPASNLRHCSPFKSAFASPSSAEAELALKQAQRAYRDGRYDDALSRVDHSLSRDDRHAGAHYLKARILDELQRFGEAHTSYQRAVDEDVCPLRAPSGIQATLLAVARAHDVPLVDFAQLAAGRSRDGIPGKDWFLDHVHPTIQGHEQLALAIIESVTASRIASAGEHWQDLCRA